MTKALAKIQQGLAARHAAERRFKAYGIGALGVAVLMLIILLVSILGPGLNGFTRHELRLEIDMQPWSGIVKKDPQHADYSAMLRGPLASTVPTGLGDRAQRHRVLQLLGFFAADDVRRAVLKHPELWGDVVPVWIPLSDAADRFLKGEIDAKAPEAERAVSDAQAAVLSQWKKDGRIRHVLNKDFFTRGDSRAPEAAGFLGSIVGSLFVLLVCMGVALPIAIMAAITLEEFARKTRFASFIEILINNLAAVPSIIYGLLGVTMFLKIMALPRSSALVGGLTLALLILPVMIIAARAAIRAVPPSMRQAAAALGATPLQVVRHHVLPYALPGIMTGTILSVCRALGETAPLLMIGMVAFIVDIPRHPLDPATAMPVEIYLWASSPEAGFVAKTSTGILVLLVLLLLLNITAIVIRNRSQKTWS